MITIPSAEQQAFQGSSPKNLTLEFPIGRTLTNENIFTESAQLEQTICDESSLTFGNVYSSCFTVRIFDDGLSYSGLRVFPHISVTEDGTTYTRDLGKFVVKSDKLTSDKIYRDLKCYDALSSVLPFDYSDWHNKQASSFTIKQYRDAFFAYVGIEQESITLPNDSVSLTKFTVGKLSGAQILSTILQLNGAFGYIGYNGKFKYVFPKITQNYSITDYSFVQGSFDYEDEPMKSITGVKIKGYSEEYGEDSYSVADVFSGNENGSVYTIDNNYLIQSENVSKRQTIANNIYVKLNGFNYYASSIQFPVYIGLELGDVFQIVTERKTIHFMVLKRTLTGISALRDTYEAKGEGQLTSNANSISGGVDSASMAINRMRLSVAELLADKASITQLDAESARIETLETNYVTVNGKIAANEADIRSLTANKADISDLTAVNAEITNLRASKAEITDLNSSNANIANLQSSYANIATLLSGNAGVGDLQAINLTVDNTTMSSALIKNLVSTNISVNDLVAGVIDTSKFRIASPNNAIVIENGTQTWSDSNGNTRIQIGQDASGNFTFVIYDETGQGRLFDSTGVKPSAISDGLVVDRMVANNASIQGSKLDIASVVTELNKDGTPVLKSNKIWFDESGQTLNQVYNQFSSSITTVGTTANDAKNLAQKASENADAAIRAIEGISSLDNVTAVLSNDSHVVHTNYDGTGGVYTYANTVVSAYKGDADISNQVTITYTASAGVTGTWTASTRIYQVTNLTEDNGYVDFVISYTPQNGNAVTVTKRFSISKSPDGRAGSAYNLQSSVDILQKNSSGVFRPNTVVFSAVESVGSITSPYSGKYRIEESSDAQTWTQEYVSSDVELNATYAPSASANYIRCTLMDASNTYLGYKTVTIIVDSQELSDDISHAQQAIQSVSSRVGAVESGIDGLSVNLSETQKELHGVSDNTLLYQNLVDYNSSDVVKIDAVVYRSGEEIHKEFPTSWFSWHKKTEDEITTIGSGYSITVNRSDFGYGGTVIGRFETFDEGHLILPDDKHLVLPDGKILNVYF